MFCPNCGSEMPNGSKFCRSCGTPLDAASQAEPEKQPEQVQYGRNQGPADGQVQYGRNQEPANYAPNQQPADYAPNQQPLNDQTRYAGEQSYAQPAFEQPAYSQPAYAQPAPAPEVKTKSKAPMVIVAALALIAVGAGVFFGISAIKKDDDDDSKSSKKSKNDSSIAEEVDDSEEKVVVDDDSKEETTTTTTTTAESIPDPVEIVDTNSGRVYNIYCWNTEFQERFENYYWPNRDTALWDGVEVNWIQNTNSDSIYQDKLDSALNWQSSADADDKVDLFLVEADYAKKYVQSDACLDVIGEIGVTNDDLSNQYQYTKDVMTDSNGTLKGVSWQACPGLFLYNAKYARSVLGTDDPDEVQAMLNDWDKFKKVADKMAEKGIAMVSSFDDTYRCFSNNVSAPWETDGVISVDPKIKEWVDQTKEYTDKGYNNKSCLWDEAWAAGQRIDGKTFGYFLPTWGIPFVLMPNTLDTRVEDGGREEVGNGGYGEWRACLGPQSYFWGGTWMCGAYGSDNIDITRDIMLKLTCDADIMAQITENEQDYTNNKEAIRKLISKGYSNAFLGGQDHLSLLTDAADKIDMSNKISAYDYYCTSNFQYAMHEYFLGNCSYEEALALFKNRMNSDCYGLSYDF